MSSCVAPASFHAARGLTEIYCCNGAKVRASRRTDSRGLCHALALRVEAPDGVALPVGDDVRLQGCLLLQHQLRGEGGGRGVQDWLGTPLGARVVGGIRRTDKQVCHAAAAATGAGSCFQSPPPLAAPEVLGRNGPEGLPLATGSICAPAGSAPGCPAAAPAVSPAGWQSGRAPCWPPPCR